MNKRTILTRGALILTPVALVAAAVGLSQRSSQDSTRQPGGDHPAETRAATGVALLARTTAPQALFAEGTERAYAIRYSTDLDAGQGVNIAKFSLQGVLTLAAVETSPNRVLGARFSGTFNGGAAADPGAPAQASLSEALQRPFLLRFSPDGRFERALGSAKTPAFVARLWQALGEYLQIVREGDGADTWEAQESDATGTYVARYAAEGSGLSKQKLRYESLRPANLKTYTVRSSKAQFRFEAGQLAGLVLKEEVGATAIEGLLANFESMTKLELDAQGAATRVDPSAWAALLESATPLDGKDERQALASHDQARIGGLSVAEALFRLRDLDSDDKEKRSRAERAFVSLTALLRQDPAALVAVKANVKKDGPLTVALLGALRDASTPEAQQFLAEMSGPNTPLSEAHRLEAARCLSRVTTPNAETVQNLEALRKDPVVGLQATYGLGSALHRLQTQDPALAARTMDLLAKHLADARSPGQKVAVLTAMGNAGSPALLEKIRSYMTDESPSVRAATAQALRRIPNRAVDELLAELSRDAVAQVRLSAIDAIRERNWSPVLASAVILLARKEPEFAIRARAVNVLSAWFPADATIGDTLRTVAEHDPHQDLRNVARNALAKHG